jgi:hypothetical protein
MKLKLRYIVVCARGLFGFLVKIDLPIPHSFFVRLFNSALASHIDTAMFTR